MKETIPAKTFLLGEYAALAGAPAIVMTTAPCFELTLSNKAGLHGIHQDSPAGRFWLQSPHVNTGLHWHDPYQGLGGMGASSAQFVGAYRASKYLQNRPYEQSEMLDYYQKHAFEGQGLRPSGYDVLAQSLQPGCVYIHQQEAICYPWPFEDITFLLVHTGQKLATHQHLKTLNLPKELSFLTSLVEQGKQSLDKADSVSFTTAVNAYYEELKRMNLVADHSLKAITALKAKPDVLAVKGCGAMGADIILLLIPKTKQQDMIQNLTKEGWNLLATHENLKITAK